MSLSKKLDNLRKKPQHVRERILLLLIAIIATVVITLWFAFFSFGHTGSNGVESLIKHFSQHSFNDPEYKATFGMPGSTPAGVSPQ